MPVQALDRAAIVTLGIEKLVATDRRLIDGRRLGLLCNPASVDRLYRHSADVLLRDSGGTLAAIFGPQHGFRADLQDNMIETPHADDGRRRVPVYSLYSDVREPSAEMLEGLDALVIDIQDVGTRVYTFIYTVANCLRAAAKRRLPVIVCDRPNPIGGVEVEGNLLREEFASFVGQFPIPMRHGMTVGELASLFNYHFHIGADLHIVAMDGWKREMYFDDTSLPWIMPSPNIPTLDSAIVYPGAVLVEGTMLSEGRGTTRPFELVGAPWIDGEALADAMNARALAGVHFRPVYFEPTFQKHAQKSCGGVQIHVTDRGAFKPVRASVELIDEFHRQSPAQFAWREPPYEYEHERMPIDILYGSDRFRLAVASGDVPPLVESWAADEDAFRRLREPFLLY
jgi:uncharacterized protein YbbC (DUF1343 family)